MHKSTPIIIFLIIVVAVAVIFLSTTDTSKWVDDGWNTPIEDGNKYTNGEWGTDIVIGYADGSTSTLRTVLGIKFGGEEVSYFKYRIFSRSTGEGFDNVSIDMTYFDVIVKMYDSSNTLIWEPSSLSGNISIIPLDNSWNKVYEITIESSDFDLDDGEYSLYFIPEGYIYVQGLPDGNTYQSELPEGKSLTFDVEEVVGDGGEGEKWINVELGSE